MKKLISFLLVALFLLGSFPATFAEEVEMHEHEGCCEVNADGGIMPLVDCDHTYGFNYEVIRQEQIECCRVRTYYRNICKECGRAVGTSNSITTNSVHLGPYSYGYYWFPDDGAKYYCKKCESCNVLVEIIS